MTNTIHLAGAVIREGRLLLVRPTPQSPWELPGGPLLPRHEDAEAGMDEILTGYGINAPAIEDDFVDTLYLPADEGQVVYNLYAPTEWKGEPEIPIGMGAGWFAFDEIEAIEMDERVRDGLLVALGVRQPKDRDGAIVSALQGSLLEAAGGPSVGNAGGTGWERPLAEATAAGSGNSQAEEAGPESRQPIADGSTRREAGLDVLRTLGATADPAAAAKAMEARQPEIAGDVIDFAMGEVWSHPALDRKTRSLQVVAMLAALGGKHGPLRSHINGALNHGATPEQVVQTMRMVAVYAGFPAALDAWPIMEDVFKARGIERPRDSEARGIERPGGPA